MQVHGQPTAVVLQRPQRAFFFHSLAHLVLYSNTQTDSYFECVPPLAYVVKPKVQLWGATEVSPNALVPIHPGLKR